VYWSVPLKFVFGVYRQLPVLSQLTVPFVGCVGVTLVGSSGAPVALTVSLPITFVVTAVFCAVFAVSGTAVTTFGCTVTLTSAVAHTGVGVDVSHT